MEVRGALTDSIGPEIFFRIIELLANKFADEPLGFSLVFENSPIEPLTITGSKEQWLAACNQLTDIEEKTLEKSIIDLRLGSTKEVEFHDADAEDFLDDEKLLFFMREKVFGYAKTTEGGDDDEK